MAIKEIPASYEYTCDKCGEIHTLATNPGRPTGWSRLVLERAAQDWHGAEVADASVNRLFCGECADSLSKLMNDWAEEETEKPPGDRRA